MFDVANVLVTWIDPIGVEQFRTIRVPADLAGSAGAFRQAVANEVSDMFGGRGMYGHDTIGLAPTDPNNYKYSWEGAA